MLQRTVLQFQLHEYVRDHPLTPASVRSGNWTLYRGKHLLCFVDNHDVSRIASNLTNEQHLPLIYALCFGMPGIPCVYYGSEWGAKANKSEGDPALRACFDAPVENDLTAWISKLAAAKKSQQCIKLWRFPLCRTDKPPVHF